jgi:hypothetical protein
MYSSIAWARRLVRVGRQWRRALVCFGPHLDCAAQTLLQALSLWRYVAAAARKLRKICARAWTMAGRHARATELKYRPALLDPWQVSCLNRAVFDCVARPIGMPSRKWLDRSFARNSSAQASSLFCRARSRTGEAIGCRSANLIMTDVGGCQQPLASRWLTQVFDVEVRAYDEN